MKQRILFAPLVALVVAGCSVFGDAEIGPGDLLLRTDAESYVAHPVQVGAYEAQRLDVIAEFRNRSAQTVYVSTCNPVEQSPVYGVRLIDPVDPEGAAYERVWACAGHDNPIAIRPGALRVDTLRLHGPNGYQSGTRLFIGRLEGSFQLQYAAYSCRELDDCRIPDSLSASNIFSIRLAD